MKTTVLSDEQMYEMLDEAHNPVTIRDADNEALFQSEIRRLCRGNNGQD